jgi:hypothetical protein
MSRYVVHTSNLPIRWGIIGTAMLWWLFLDRFEAPGWAWGAAGVLWLIMTTGFLVDAATSKKMTLWDKEGRETKR